MDCKIEIQPVVVGEPILFAVTFDGAQDGDTKKTMPATVIAKDGKILRHRVERRLPIDPDKDEIHYSGQVKTADGTSLQSDTEETTLRVRANDTVTVSLEGGQQEQVVASGVDADDIFIGRSIPVQVVDPAAAMKNVRQIEVVAKILDSEKAPVSITLQREAVDSDQYSGILDTRADDALEVPENALAVKDGNRVSFAYAHPEGNEVHWQVQAFSRRKAHVQVTGGVFPGKSFEITVVDSDCTEDHTVSVFVLNHETGTVMEKQLARVEGAPWTFTGVVRTTSKRTNEWVTVQPKDTIEVVYRDAKRAFHRESLQVLESREAINDLAWQKKYCCRAFFMPSLKLLLAELKCLEVRLHYYRSTATGISDHRRVDLLEESLRRADTALNDNKWDLTTAWEALHDARHQELYLLEEAEAEGERYQILADAATLVSAEHQKHINVLIDKSEKQQRKDPATDRWRGYMVAAMKILHEQQDGYYIRQNMVRDRMMLMTLFLALFLFGFFYIQWGSNIADALVNNRSINEIFSQKSPLAHPFEDVAEEQRVAIQFFGETIIGQPLVLGVFDRDAKDQHSVMAELRCTDETASLCPKWKEPYSLDRVPGRPGWYRFILETRKGDPAEKSPGALVFAPGAEVVASYRIAQTGEGDKSLPAESARTRMLDAKWFPKISLSSGRIIIAACLLGAIGACLSTLMGLRSGNQIPNFFDSIMITMVRPVIGFTAALLLFISLNAKLLNFEPTLTMYWMLCFVSGFSDRLVLGVVSKFDGSQNEAK